MVTHTGIRWKIAKQSTDRIGEADTGARKLGASMKQSLLLDIVSFIAHRRRVVLKNGLRSLRHYGLYDYDVSTIKQMGCFIRIANLKACRHPGLVLDRKFSKKGTVNLFKLENNIARAKSIVREYALCNEWDFFCTFTINKNLYDRYDFPTFYKHFAKFISNYNRSCNEEEKVKYLLIPEMHKDGAWHMHGLLKGIRNKDTYINKNGFMSWKQYEERFGFISFSPIDDINRCCNYILKYISKDISKSVSELGCHLYYAPNGLKRGELLFRGNLRLKCNWDYETPDGFCRIKNFDNRHEDYTSMIEVMG